MPCVSAAPGCHVHHTAGKPPEIGVGITCDDAELLNSVLRHHKGNRVSAENIDWGAVNILGALALDGAADLVVTPPLVAGPSALVESRAARARAPWHHARSKGNQVHHITAIERQFPNLRSVYLLAHGARVSLQQWRFGYHFHGFTGGTHIQYRIDADDRSYSTVTWSLKNRLKCAFVTSTL